VPQDVRLAAAVTGPHADVIRINRHIHARMITQTGTII
jgi:hypothetical protein